jgi:hypothetical protein
MRKSTILLALALAGGCHDDEEMQRGVPEALSVELNPLPAESPKDPEVARLEPIGAVRDEQEREQLRTETVASARAVERANEKADEYVAPTGLDDPSLRGSLEADRARQDLAQNGTRSQFVSAAREQLVKLDDRTAQLSTKLGDVDVQARSEANALLSQVPAQRKAAELDLKALETVRAANFDRKRLRLERRLATLDSTLDHAESKLTF